jgi:hypothetical protein
MPLLDGVIFKLSKDNHIPDPTILQALSRIWDPKPSPDDGEAYAAWDRRIADDLAAHFSYRCKR